MQLGMIGLGRMGANLVRRLLRDGHDCAHAGNAALSLLATGGVFLGGGIAPKLLPRLRAGGFIAAFLDKGRFLGLLERIPVRVILDDRTALLGAARAAREGA